MGQAEQAVIAAQQSYQAEQAALAAQQSYQAEQAVIAAQRNQIPSKQTNYQAEQAVIAAQQNYPDVPGAEQVIRAQKQLLRNNIAPTTGLPGSAAHAAAEAAVLDLSRPGFNAHATAEASVLFAQGRVPANMSPSKVTHHQAEQAVLTAQDQLRRSNMNIAPTAGLSGYAAHAAAEAAVLDRSRPGFNAHAAAETAVLLAQGHVPVNLSPGELAHYQAERAVLATQQNLQVQG